MLVLFRNSDLSFKLTLTGRTAGWRLWWKMSKLSTAVILVSLIMQLLDVLVGYALFKIAYLIVSPLWGDHIHPSISPSFCLSRTYYQQPHSLLDFHEIRCRILFKYCRVGVSIIKMCLNYLYPYFPYFLKDFDKIPYKRLSTEQLWVAWNLV